jgi:hypothetical protein
MRALRPLHSYQDFDVDPDGGREPADWVKLFGILANSGFRGYVSTEIETNDNPVPKFAAEEIRVARMFSDSRLRHRGWEDLAPRQALEARVGTLLKLDRAAIAVAGGLRQAISPGF